MPFLRFAGHRARTRGVFPQVIARDKQMVKGDIRIDDGIHNLVNCEGIKLLFDAPHNRRFNEAPEMTRVYDWKQIYDIIHRMGINEDNN